MMNKKVRKAARGVAFYAFATLLAVIVCVPFFWMVITSLKSKGALMSIPVEWIPKEPSLDSYKRLLSIPNFSSSIVNSFYLSIASTVARLISASLAAFALTKISFKGREFTFKLYITAMMIPMQITFIPLFIVMTRLNLTNSLNAFMLLQLFNAFSLFMLRQKMRTINNAYIEAAVIDGASMFQIYRKIVMPLCSGTLGMLGVLAFMDLWNDYLMPMVMLTDRTKYTLPLVLSTLQGQYKNQYNLIMAGSLVSIIPILIVYISAQKFFKEGLQVGGVKG